MHLKDVLKKCKEKGHPMSAQGLYKAGIKNGFLVVPEERNKYDSWEFNKPKFNEWLKKALEEIPKGWLTIKQLSEKLGVSVSRIYYTIRDEEVGAQRFGVGEGVIYADPERVIASIRKREQSHKEFTEDE